MHLLFHHSIFVVSIMVGVHNRPQVRIFARPVLNEVKDLKEVTQESANLANSYFVFFNHNMKRSKDSCETQEFNQTIRKRGCIPVTIPNKICTGECNSYYIPYKAQRSNDVHNVFQNCRQCVPKSYQKIAVVLKCPNRRRKHKVKKVKLIYSCRCKSNTCTLKWCRIRIMKWTINEMKWNTRLFTSWIDIYVDSISSYHFQIGFIKPSHRAVRHYDVTQIQRNWLSFPILFKLQTV